jgi:proteasome accessory factor A
MYGNLDEEKGLFWTCAANGVVEQIVSPALIERYMTEPPDDTRAYTRGRLIKEAVDYRVEAANWDSMSLRSNAAGSRGALTTIYMDTPLGRTRNESSQLFRNGPISAGQLPARTGAGAIANQLGKENLPPSFMKAPNIYHVKKKRQLPPHVEIVDQILD